MNDKELADRVVALGVGYTEIFPPARTTFYFHESIGMPMDAGEFLEKWDIAGALMEKAYHHEQHYEKQTGWSVRVVSHCSANARHKWAENESLPRAIIEACVEALDGEGK